VDYGTNQNSSIDDTVDVRLSVEPTANVRVDFVLDGQVEVWKDGVKIDYLEFDSDNWDDPVTLTVKAVNDTDRENAKVSEIGFEFTSVDPVYGDAPKATLDVKVLDDDSPRVLVTESDGKTELVRGELPRATITRCVS
jgi:hypothetical protein